VVFKSLGRIGMATAMAVAFASSPVASQSVGIAASSQARVLTPVATYDAVLDGMACKQQKSGRMDCEYRVGRAVRFVVAGVGQDDVVVSFVQVDSAGDYSASIVPLHGCVVVKPTRATAQADSVATFAYVSPKTGKVYHTWATCLSATKGDIRVDAKPDSKPDVTKAPATKVAAPTAKVAPLDTAKRVAPRRPPAR
jgi:hypothetical protein